MDGGFCIAGCDKNKPGAVLSMLFANVPAIYVDAGTIKPGKWKGEDTDIVSAFQSVGEISAGRMSREDFEGIECNACPGVGVCGGQYTANTMACATAALGLSLINSPLMAAEDQEKLDSVAESARVLKKAIEKDLKPRDIVTRKSIWNAVAAVMATQGSTNAVLHILAIAKAARIKWTLDDFEGVCRKAPVLCDLKPSGRYMAVSLSSHRWRGASVENVARPWRSPWRVHDHHRPHDGRGVVGCTIGTTKQPGSDPPMVESDVQNGPPQGCQG